MTDTDNKTVPVKIVYIGCVVASIWKSQDGFYTASIDRRYKDKKTGERLISNAFSLDDLAAVAQVAAMAADEIVKLQSQSDA